LAAELNRPNLCCSLPPRCRSQSSTTYDEAKETKQQTNLILVLNTSISIHLSSSL